jgi:hypothetical protein
MKRYMWHLATLFAAALLLSANGMAQPIVGTPLRLGTGITKTVDEMIAFSAEAERQAGTQRQPIELKEELHAPMELPAPGEENRLFSRSTPQFNAAARPAEIATPTQQIWSNFMGSDFSSAGGGWPPDNNGDVGPTQLLLIQNYRVKVYPKPSVTAPAVTTPNGATTTLLASPVLDISLNNFFRTAIAGVNTTDPHVRYDRLSGRWFIVAMSTNEATNNRLLFAVSSAATITPTSASAVGTSFTFFSTSISAFAGDAGRFLDYPTLGVDRFSLYIGANIFSNSSGSFVQTSGYVVNKADMLAGALTITPFSGIGTTTTGLGTDMRTPQGVHNDDPAATEGFIVGSSAFFSQLIIRRITYSGTTPILQPQVALAVATTRSPIKQPALGSSAGLDASNTRLFAAMIMKNKIDNTFSLWTAHNIGVTAAGVSSTTTANNDRNGSRWYEIRDFASATPTVAQFGTHYNDAAASPRGFWFPSIAMSGQGHAILATSSSSPADRIDINIAGRYRTTVSGDLEDSLYATVSTSDYNPFNGATFVDRWGDYSQVVVDPVDNMTMWAFHQYTNTTNSYGVRAVQLKAPRPPSFTVTSSTGNFCGTLVNVTLTGIVTNNREFFDPGADAGGPGFNRLAVTVSGGTPLTSIPTTNINFVSPTQVNFRMNTVAALAPAGTYVVTVTNPDGQTSTSTFELTGPCTSIPVTLTEFNGRLVNEQAQLNWTTSAEYNSKEFVVEKSIDGVRFSPLATVAAKGFSNTLSNYALTDKSPYPVYSYYRLKMVDKDATFTYSNIVRIATPKKALAITKLFPNPAREKVSLEIVTEKQQSVNLNLIDFSGKRVYKKSLLLTTGLNEADIDLQRFAAGTYIIEAVDDKGAVFYKTTIVKN